MSKLKTGYPFVSQNDAVIVRKNWGSKSHSISWVVGRNIVKTHKVLIGLSMASTDLSSVGLNFFEYYAFYSVNKNIIKIENV